MTKHVVLIPLSTLVPCYPDKSKDAFAKLGVTTWQFVRHWFSWNNLITQYRNGRFSHEQFRNSLKNIFPVLKQKADAAIDDAWNAMCQYDEHSAASFQMIKDLERQRTEVYLFASTNEKHVEFIQQKLQNELETASNKHFGTEIDYLATMPGKHFWFFENKDNLLGRDLVTSLVQKIKVANPLASIELFYTQPVDPAPGFLGWFQKPYAKFMHQGALKHVKQLHLNAKRLGFELIESTHERLASALEEIYINRNQVSETQKTPQNSPVIFRKRNISNENTEITNSTQNYTPIEENKTLRLN